jgi:hypothetical protein
MVKGMSTKQPPTEAAEVNGSESKQTNMADYKDDLHEPRINEPFPRQKGTHIKPKRAKQSKKRDKRTGLAAGVLPSTKKYFVSMVYRRTMAGKDTVLYRLVGAMLDLIAKKHLTLKDLRNI